MTLCLVTLSTLSVAQNADRPYTARAWFPDGTGLEIYTETTGSTHTSSTQGVIGIFDDVVNRLVVTKDNNILFAYNLEASRAPGSDAVLIRIEPINSKVVTEMLNIPGMAKRLTGSRFPTVAAVREFRSVKIGEVVTLDILYNPSTGEKVYDVLRPITDPSPAPAHPVAAARPTREQFSLKDITLRVNGRRMQVPAPWMIGAAVRLDIPGHGMYVLAVDDSTTSRSGYTFNRRAHAERNSLSWVMDGDRVEITSKTNVLVRAESGDIWVFHDSRYRSHDQPDNVKVRTADSVEWLLPKK